MEMSSQTRSRTRTRSSLDEKSTLGNSDNAQARRLFPHEDAREEKEKSKASIENLCAMYIREAAQDDKEMVTYLTDDMSALITFAGLFSAAVTAFVIESYKSLKPDSGDIANDYLKQITVQLAFAQNGSTAPAPTPPPPFIPEKSAVLVNMLWVSSLITSLACALGALLVQNWTKRYIKRTTADPNTTPGGRAPFQAYYREGLSRSGLGLVTILLPALMHASLILFFIGLVQFLYPINKAVASVAMWLIFVWGLVYVIFTFAPILIRNSPYLTPLTLVLRTLIGFPAFLAICTVRILTVAGYNIARFNDSGLFRGIVNDTRFMVAPNLRKLQHFVDDHRELRLQDIDLDGPLRWLMTRAYNSRAKAFLEFLETATDAATPEIGTHSPYIQAIMRLANYVPPHGSGIGSLTGAVIGYAMDPEQAVTATLRARYITSSLRFLWTVSVYSLPEHRLERSREDVKTTVWMEMCDQYLLEALTEVDTSDSPSIALLHRCTSSVIISRTIQDLALRIQSGEVRIHFPTEWSIADVICAIGSGRRQDPNEPSHVECELAEFGILYSLFGWADDDSPALSSRVSNSSIAYQDRVKSQDRWIEAIINGSTGRHLASSEMLYEASLLNLLGLLEDLCDSEYNTTPEEASLVVETIRVVTEEWCSKQPQQRNSASQLSFAGMSIDPISRLRQHLDALPDWLTEYEPCKEMLGQVHLWVSGEHRNVGSPMKAGSKESQVKS